MSMKLDYKALKITMGQVGDHAQGEMFTFFNMSDKARRS